jgi:hypothetical protein
MDDCHLKYIKEFPRTNSAIHLLATTKNPNPKSKLNPIRPRPYTPNLKD